MTQKKKKLYTGLLIITIISLLIGVLSYVLIAKICPDKNSVFWAFPFLGFAFAFLFEKLFDAILNKILQIKSGVKFYFTVGLIIYILYVIAMIVMYGKPEFTNPEYYLPLIETIFFGEFGVALPVFLFTFGKDFEEEISISFDEYRIVERIFRKENVENICVSLSNKLSPESYFENDDYANAFISNSKVLQQKAEEEAKKIIFEEQLETKLPGCYFLARIDFVKDEGYTPTLVYTMTFYTVELTKYEVNFVDIGSSKKEKEFCNIHCYFEYDSSKTENPFTFSDIEIEYL